MSDPNKLFDGIAQADNPMPAWYVVSFIGSLIIGVLYLGYYHVLNDFSQEAQFAEEVAAHQKAHPEANKAVDASNGNPFAGDAAAIATGKEIFSNTCAACHGADAKGVVGPNLTDATWLHGGTEKEVFHSIMEGIPADKALQKPPKGPMPPHKASLGAEKVWKVIAFLEHEFKNIKRTK